jgi:DNA polymerase III delta subunit
MKPVLIIHGTDEFLCSRFASQVCRKLDTDGWDIEYINYDQVDSVLSSQGFSLFKKNILTVVSNAEKINSTSLLDYSNQKDFSLVFLLLHKGLVSASYPLHSILSKVEKKFELPPIYKMEEFTINFIQKEAKSFNKSIDRELAKSLINILGTDRGFLSFEIMKYALHSEGSEITLEDIVKCRSLIFESSVFPLVKSLGMKSISSFLRNMSLVQKTHGSEPTMKVCGLLASQVQKWLCASYLFERGVSSKDIAQKIEMSHRFYNKTVERYLSKWKRKELVELIHVLADSERSVKEGIISPWNLMVSKITKLLLY